MKVTSLELSKQIYAAFPEWNDCYFGWFETIGGEDNGGYWKGPMNLNASNSRAPAYDTDYLLDKLPSRIELKQRAGRSWDADYYGGVIKDGSISDTSTYTHADTPAEALGLLVLELKKAGIEF